MMMIMMSLRGLWETRLMWILNNDKNSCQG